VLVRRALEPLSARRPDLEPQLKELMGLLLASPTRRAQQPQIETPIPVDQDSRLALLRRESRPELETDPC
jgi:hypothetical protein